MYVCLWNKSEYIDFILTSPLIFAQLTDTELSSTLSADNFYDFPLEAIWSVTLAPSAMNQCKITVKPAPHYHTAQY